MPDALTVAGVEPNAHATAHEQRQPPTARYPTRSLALAVATPHNAKSIHHCEGCVDAMVVRDSPRFFLVPKLPFDTARVNLDPELLLHQVRQSFGSPGWLGNACLGQELHRRRGQLVA